MISLSIVLTQLPDYTIYVRTKNGFIFQVENRKETTCCQLVRLVNFVMHQANGQNILQISTAQKLPQMIEDR